MDKVIFSLPVPSTSMASPEFEMRLGRKCALQYVYEDHNSTVLIKEVLEFDGVEAFKRPITLQTRWTCLMPPIRF